MKLLVTGGLGFIGSNFILNLLKNHDEHEIINLDAEFYGSNSVSLAELPLSENYQYIKGNICNSQLIDKLISDCDAVINFAAESFVDRSISDAKPFLKSNIDGVFSLLESIKKHKKKFVQISTDEVFGSLEKDSATEKFPFNPSSPYAATKASAEMLVNSYHITYDCDTVITRCTNNYGPRQFPEKLIPKIILLAEKNRKIPIYGTGKNLRDWLFVDDHCDAIYSILKNGKSGQSYNISSNTEIDNLTIVKKILSIMEKSEDLIEFVEDRPGHDFRYSMNSDKLRNELDWNPKINFDDGLKNTVNWYLSNTQWWKDLSEHTLENTPWKK
ncbi:MAG: dTDP-glucose 4,6-dehydratase [Candidatus Nitrosopumilus sp. bin_68KS]